MIKTRLRRQETARRLEPFREYEGEVNLWLLLGTNLQILPSPVDIVKYHLIVHLIFPPWDMILGTLKGKPWYQEAPQLMPISFEWEIKEQFRNPPLNWMCFWSHECCVCGNILIWHHPGISSFHWVSGPVPHTCWTWSYRKDMDMNFILSVSYWTCEILQVFVIFCFLRIKC